MRRFLVFFALIAVSIQASILSLEAVWTPREMVQVYTFHDVQLSPDNKTVVFAASCPAQRGEKEAFITQLFKKVLHGERDPTPLTQKTSSCVQPQWSPDGKWVAFLSDRSGVFDLYLINPNGGEATALTKMARNIQTFLWSPDSQHIAFVMADDKLANQPSKTKIEAIVYDQDLTINRLWIIDVLSPSKPKPLTTDDFYVRGKGDFGTTNIEFDWAPDSSAITFGYSPGAGFEYYHQDSSLATLDLQTGQIVRWEKKAQHESMPRYSPDGKWIAYLESDTPTGWLMDRRVAVRAKDASSYRQLAPTDNAGVFLAGPNLLGWGSDGQRVLVFEPKGTKFHLQYVPLDGTPAQTVATGDLFFNCPALSKDRTMLGFVAQTPEKPPEAQVAALHDFKPKPISQLNQKFERYPTARTEIIKWQAPDGVEIEGLLTYPLNYEAGKRYPLLLVIHGGPVGFFNEGYLGGMSPYPLAAFAEEGFAILRPNPRGSTGYGRAFRMANVLDWGGKDYFDLMAGVDAVIASGVADGDRLGVMGWSYGGYMTAWIITQTNRFKAASVGAAPANLTSMYGTTDIPGLPQYYLGDLAANFDLIKSRSPIYFVDRVMTPCVIQHGLEDVRVPVTQAYEAYRALKHKQKEVVLLLYPRTPHGVAEPSLAVEVMEKNLQWFKEYLQNH